MNFKNKQRNYNPRKGGPYHYKAPSMMFWRTVRGMVPHKTKRGTAAMERLKVFEGCPYPYSHTKKMVAARALKVLRLKNGRKCCLLGELSKSIGWNYTDVLNRLEEKRSKRATEWHKNKASLKKAVDLDLKKVPEVQKLR